MKVKTGIILVLVAIAASVIADDTEQEQNAVEELVVETLVKPEICTETSEMGDTLQIHYTGRLLDGKVIDSSLSRDPLVVELGKRTVISGLEQSLVGVCAGQKIKATIPPHLGYGKRGYPPTIPGDSVLQFEVEVVSLTQQTPWQRVVNNVFPILCLVLVPMLLGLVGLYLYNKAKSQRPSKKTKDKKSKLKKK